MDHARHHNSVSTVRKRYAHAGVVITASHNPYHDNGFKAYFNDGGTTCSSACKQSGRMLYKISTEDIKLVR